MSRQKLSENNVFGYCLEMSNQYSPFQYVLERCGAKILFLKYWSRKKFRETKFLDAVWGCQISIHYSSILQKGARPKFISENIGPGKNLRETKYLNIVWRWQIKILHTIKIYIQAFPSVHDTPNPP